MTSADKVFAQRRRLTDRRLSRFTAALQTCLGPDRRRFARDTCIYVTGSGGRGELSAHSDLDVFVLRETPTPSALDAIEIKASVIKSLRMSGFPPPSRDGEFLEVHRVDDVLTSLGTPADDALNLFTARMLLLLESRCVEGGRVYARVIDRVIGGYWRDHKEHSKDYLPIVLLNDISRYWRIVLLNYEARRNESDAAAHDERTKASRHLRSHKLRFSRCMLCYSAITYLLGEVRRAKGHVERESVREMVAMTPIERFRRVASVGGPGVGRHVDALLEDYAEFLARVDAPEDALVARFMQESFRRQSMRAATEFGEKMFKLVQGLGDRNPLYRYLVV